MNIDQNCFYCTKDDRLDQLMIKVCQLKQAFVYLLKDQTYKGRCVVAYNQHKRELFELNEFELCEFMKEVAFVAKTITTLFSPDKINYAVYGDTVSHVHFHLVPKYKGQAGWGKAFDLGPAEKKLLSESEYDELVSSIKYHLSRTTRP